ncbi:MAG: nucleotidyl transferase AbiEii/AbiGii toxin family protein [Flavobacteriales bacterium]|nr:nucleotidyl transferase AbiEii/AbiGii toxin family protein [Flavobacteriales bacterium]
MLQLQTVKPDTLELLKSLMEKEYLHSFVLVGGTALALQMGNRESIDLDLFSTADFSSNEILSALLNDYQIVVNNQQTQTLISTINQVKVDFIKFHYPFIRPFVTIENIRMASIEDIAAMKLDAITGRGSKKDFYDLYFLLQHYSIDDLFSFYSEKYPHQTSFHVMRSLLYFDDAEIQPNPIVFNKSITWELVKQKISSTIQAI